MRTDNVVVPANFDWFNDLFGDPQIHARMEDERLEKSGLSKVSLKFSRFMDGDYPEENYQLYVVRSDRVLYVGISRSDIYSRWFSGTRGHIIERRDGSRFGQSHVGQYIIEHMPQSLDWIIELWTIHACLRYCDEMVPGRLVNQDRSDILRIEPVMISLLKPILNLAHNSRNHRAMRTCIL